MITERLVERIFFPIALSVALFWLKTEPDGKYNLIRLSLSWFRFISRRSPPTQSHCFSIGVWLKFNDFRVKNWHDFVRAMLVPLFDEWLSHISCSVRGPVHHWKRRLVVRDARKGPLINCR